MKNILDESPSYNLSGRPLASVMFVDDNDLNNKTVLDIGCGYGWCEINFLSRGVRKIVGIEVSDNDLDTIRKNINSDKLEIHVSSATNLSFEAESFDTVVSWEVIEHIPKGDERKMLNEVARVLKPNGVFYLSTPHSTFFTNTLDPAWWFGHRHYSIGDINRFAEGSSLTVELVKIKGAWWSLFYILNMYISKWGFRRKPIFDELFSYKEDSEYMNDNGFANLFIKLRKSP